ncbi:MAG: hypothetical protein K0R18_882 [Bacillales bacterium]|nr:hypothetical protein [Bacillales bacterium]
MDKKNEGEKMRIASKEEYVSGFNMVVNIIKKRNESGNLDSYFTKQLIELGDLIESISEENFWQILPEILGIDAKLNLITELIRFEDFSEEEIIRITESDYSTYYKELCGYDLSMKTKHSLLFNVS